MQLRNDITGFKQDVATPADGSFSFNNIPYNPYELHVDVQGFQPSHRAVDVHSPVAVEETTGQRCAHGAQADESDRDHDYQPSTVPTRCRSS